MENRAQFFDICIVCALYEEAEAVLNEFTRHCNVSFTSAFSSTDRYEYRHTIIQNNRGERLTVLVTWLADNGPVRTGLHLKPFLQEFHPRFAAMTGICAGCKDKDVRLGDLVVAEYAYHYERGKDTIGKDGQKKHEPQTTTYGVTPQVLQYAKSFQGWRKPVARLKRPKIKQEKIKGSEPLKEKLPTCHIAPMASGMAVKEDEPFPWLREYINRKTIALDMEAATFYLTLQEVSSLGIHSLVVKGVSDYADGSKNDEYHKYAERASAIYLLYFIQEYVTSTTMPRRSSPSSSIRDRPAKVWNVPYSRNPHFTGREELLNQLYQRLTPVGQNDPAKIGRVALAQTQAVKGLGGIGKTQIAVEFAYRSRDLGHYTHILWVNAATEETIIASFREIAKLLPSFLAKDETDQQKLMEAIKRWLERCEQRWLLIFDNVDNADNLPIIQEYFPQRGYGSVLLTTRANAVGSLAAFIEVGNMGLMEGVQLLLHRANRLDGASDEEINEAINVVIALDYFPLALDQAGAYIEETKCGFVDYLQMYQSHRQALLERRGLQATNYPDSVATTWLLSFQKVEQANPAAAELLRLCAFLAPDMIPEELIRDGAAYWVPSLQYAATDLFTFNQMIAELLKFSLIERLAEARTFSIHRLVQAVQVDMMKLETQYQWAERVVRGIDLVFPVNPRDTAVWPQCLRFLNQAQKCYILIKDYDLSFVEAANLLNRTGIYLYEHGLYTVSEPLYQYALRICKQRLGLEHPSTATSLNNLAALYQDWGKYTEAEALYQSALHIYEQQLGLEHPTTAACLNALALLYQKQGRYTEAEPLLHRALHIYEQRLGAEHPTTATSLNSLASLYQDQGKYAEAESLYQRTLQIHEQRLGLEHLDTAASLNNLALLYQDQGKYAEAEPLYQRALRIHEHWLGLEHPRTATSLNNLALLYQDQGKYAEAEPLYQRALSSREQLLGVNHPDTATSLNNLASLYQDQGKYAEAESLYQRALYICEQQLGVNHPDTAANINNLASLYQDQGKYAEAEPLYQRAPHICEQQLGVNHPKTAASLNNLGLFYRVQRKYAEAEPLYQRALHICEQQLGVNHPDTLASCNNLASLYQEQGKYAEAEPFLQRILHIYEQQLGVDHLKTADSLYDLALFYQKQSKYEEAESLYQRALHICEQQLGADHLDMATSLNNLALLYQKQDKYTEAELLLQRALHIFEHQLGIDHPKTEATLNNLVLLYRVQSKYEEVEPLLQRTLYNREQRLGNGHLDTATSLNALARLYWEQGKYIEAEPLLQRALHIYEQQLGKEHSKTAASLNALARLYWEQGKYIEAEPLLRRALHIYEQQLGKEHPYTRKIHTDYASFLKAQRIDEEANKK